MKINNFIKLVPIFILFLAGITNVSAASAFPGAEGYGATATGGRGGQIIKVTNLNNSGAGSLRACIDATGARTCVFEVGGTIQLESNLEINNDNITIAGQTAPGSGIMLKAKNLSATKDQISAFIKVNANNVIIRYISSRPGLSDVNQRALSIGKSGGNTQKVIIDHSSFSWSADELMIAWYTTQDISLQWNIFSETFQISNGSEVEGQGPNLGGYGNYSFHHNLLAHHKERSPRIKASTGFVDIVNNIIYNPGESGGWGASHISDGTKVNYVGNMLIPGPDTTQTSHYVSIDTGSAYLKGNITPLRTNDSMDEKSGVLRSSDASKAVSTRFSAPTVTTTTASQAQTDVLNKAGNSYGLDCNGNFFARRDAVDNRIVNDTKNKTGNIIKRRGLESDFPTYSNGTKCTDADNDGMSDAWESAKGVTANNADDDNDGFTNIEEFLNGTNPKSADNTVPVPTATPTPTGTATPVPTGSTTPTPTGTATPTPIPGTNSKVSVSAITTYNSSSDDPYNTIDGNLSADSQWSTKVKGGWIQYELSSTSAITFIKLAFEDTRIYKLTIQTSADGNSWTTVIDKTESNGTGETFQTFNLNSTNTKYIRIIGDGNNVNDSFTITEFEGYTGNTTTPNTTCASLLSDISSHGMLQYICAARAKGIINGFSNGTFQPDAGATRGQIASMLVRAFSLSADISNVSLKDIPNKTDEINKNVLTLVALGIVNGYSDGSFKKDRIVTRGELSKMLVNTLTYKQAYSTCSTSHTFGDLYNNTFREHIACLASLTGNGEYIVKGFSPVNGVVYFKPDQPVTRAQVAKMIYIATLVNK